VQVLEHRQGVRIACLEEIALGQGFIDAEQALKLGDALAKSGYGEYVIEVAKRHQSRG
jgi:glucose-1-phosphate thymidylyltransferase